MQGLASRRRRSAEALERFYDELEHFIKVTASGFKVATGDVQHQHNASSKFTGEAKQLLFGERVAAARGIEALPMLPHDRELQARYSASRSSRRRSLPIMREAPRAQFANEK